MEVADYLERYPQTKHVDVYLNDINGTMRGKRLSVESMLSLEKAVIFPFRSTRWIRKEKSPPAS